jgi:hypothetical protein
MNLVSLAEFRRPAERQDRWNQHEAAELNRLYQAHRERRWADGFAYGKTDFDDPQFYILGTGGAEVCATCVSRLTRDGRSWYVIEDGQGQIHSEGDCLRALIARMVGRSLGAWRALGAILALFLQQFLADGAVAQDFSEWLVCFG